jgi:branched-subunit amino acid transport protein AzlD
MDILPSNGNDFIRKYMTLRRVITLAVLNFLGLLMIGKLGIGILNSASIATIAVLTLLQLVAYLFVASVIYCFFYEVYQKENNGYPATTAALIGGLLLMIYSSFALSWNLPDVWDIYVQLFNMGMVGALSDGISMAKTLATHAVLGFVIGAYYKIIKE